MLGCPGCGSIEQDGTNDNVKQGRVGAGGAVATAFKETGSQPHPPPTSPEPRPSLPLPTIPIPAHHPCSPSPPPPCCGGAVVRGSSAGAQRKFRPLASGRARGELLPLCPIEIALSRSSSCEGEAGSQHIRSTPESTGPTGCLLLS